MKRFLKLRVIFIRMRRGAVYKPVSANQPIVSVFANQPIVPYG
jgi:hypothetical protein